MSTTTPTPDLEALAHAYYSDKGPLALGSQFMASALTNRVIWDAVFIGILFGQTIKWVPKAKNDNLVIRILVPFALMGCVAATVYTWKNYFEAFVIHFGTYLRFASWNHLGLYTLFNGLTIIPVEVVFADRAIRINGNSKALALGLYTLIAGTTACTIGSLVTTRGHTMFDGTKMMVCFFLAQGSICAAMHLSVTAAIIYGLLKNREGSRRTNRLIDRTAMITLEGQIPGTIISIIAILLAAINLGNPFIPWMLVVHPKFYMMGTMAMLNTRHSWAQEGMYNAASGRTYGTSLQSFPSASLSSDKPLSFSPSNPARITVRRSTVQMIDDMPTLSEGWEIEKAKHSANKAMKKAFGRLSAAVAGEKQYRTSASFGPVFTDAQLGSKVSMV